MKNSIKTYFDTLREGNIIGILQLLYISVFAALNFILYIFPLDTSLVILIHFITYLSLSCYIYSNRHILIRWTNELLILFLSSFAGQLFVFYMTRLELIFLCNTESAIGAYGLALALGVLTGSFNQLSYFSQHLLFITYLILFFWWRFRTTFYNVEYLASHSDIDVNKAPLVWKTFIFMFNSLFSKKALEKKQANYNKIPDRLTGTLAQAIFNMYKHNPKATIGVGSLLGVGTAGYYGHEQYQRVQDRNIQDAQHTKGLALQREQLALQKEQLALQKEQMVSEQLLKTHEIETNQLLKKYEIETNLSKEYSLEMSKQRHPSEVLKEGLRGSQERLEKLNLKLDNIKVDFDSSIIKESVETTQIYSILENSFITFL